jgi:hypothetical protein
MFSWNHKAQLRKAQNSDFHAGETWEYHTRPLENGSTFFVWRVETLPDHSNVVHIKLEGLRISSALAPDGLMQVAEHLPVSETALSGCATRKVSSGEALPMPEGYEQWRREWERGRAGVFTTSLGEIADFLEQALAKDGDAPPA